MFFHSVVHLCLCHRVFSLMEHVIILDFYAAELLTLHLAVLFVL
jgi:hypothetical protein